MPVKILLADDHSVVRQGLCLLLEEEPDFRVVGETGDGLEVAALVERLQPDVLVLDLILPGLSGLDVARQVHRQSPATRMVILSMHGGVAYVAESLSAGARAYVLKKSTAEELVHAIREVMAGRQYLGSALSEDMGDIQERLAAHRGKVEDTLGAYESLTGRERQVLQLVGEGYTSAEVAERLVISPRTVDMHRRHILRKLGLSGEAALARYAVQRGLIPEPH
jgi:DNA-binding NarL/FixJ family response regulator